MYVLFYLIDSTPSIIYSCSYTQNKTILLWKQELLLDYMLFFPWFLIFLAYSRENSLVLQLITCVHMYL